MACANLISRLDLIVLIGWGGRSRLLLALLHHHLLLALLLLRLLLLRHLLLALHLHLLLLALLLHLLLLALLHHLLLLHRLHLLDVRGITPLGLLDLVEAKAATTSSTLAARCPIRHVAAHMAIVSTEDAAGGARAVGVEAAASVRARAVSVPAHADSMLFEVSRNEAARSVFRFGLFWRRAPHNFRRLDPNATTTPSATVVTKTARAAPRNDDFCSGLGTAAVGALVLLLAFDGGAGSAAAGGFVGTAARGAVGSGVGAVADGVGTLLASALRSCMTALSVVRARVFGCAYAACHSSLSFS